MEWSTISTVPTSLRDFLQAHPPNADFQVLSWRADGPRTLRCVLEAYPWWRGEVDGPVANERLEITFHDVHDTSVGLVWAPGWEDDLAVKDDDPLLWPHGTHATIFGNSRMPDPRRFFAEFWDLFHVELRAGGAVQFPFQYHSFRDWAQRVTSHDSYKLLDGPARVMEPACALLDAQSVRYRLLRGPERSTAHLQAVWIGRMWIVCRDAAVEHLPPEDGKDAIRGG